MRKAIPLSLCNLGTLIVFNIHYPTLIHMRHLKPTDTGYIESKKAQLEELSKQRNDILHKVILPLGQCSDFLNLDVLNALKPNPIGIYRAGRLQPLALVTDRLFDANNTQQTSMIWPGVTRPGEEKEEISFMLQTFQEAARKGSIYCCSLEETRPKIIHAKSFVHAKYSAEGDANLAWMKMVEYHVHEWFSAFVRHNEHRHSIDPVADCLLEPYQTWTTIYNNSVVLDQNNSQLRYTDDELAMAKQVAQKAQSYIQASRTHIKPLLEKLESIFHSYMDWNTFTISMASSAHLLIEMGIDIRAQKYLDAQIEQIQQELSDIS